MKYTTEIVRQIWCDDDGSRVEVSPDRDGLGLLEIRWYSPVANRADPEHAISMDPQQAILVANALYAAAEEAIAQEEPKVVEGDA